MTKSPSPASEFLPVRTPHLFMWICDGSNLDENAMPIPTLSIPQQGGGPKQVDYVEVLEGECDKLAKTETPVFLVYKGSLLKKGQVSQIDSLASRKENLFVIDYDSFVSVSRVGVTCDAVSDILFDEVAKSYSAFVETKGSGVNTEEFQKGVVHGDRIGTMANLVDLIKLHLVHNCDALRDEARHYKYRGDADKAKYCEILANVVGLVWRDFDVTLKAAKMPDDMRLIDGQVCSINAIGRARQLADSTVESLKEAGIYSKKKGDSIREYFDGLANDPELISRYIRVFLLDEIDPQGKITKEDLKGINEKSRDETYCSNADIVEDFLNKLTPENCFFAVTEDRSRRIAEAVEGCYGPNVDSGGFREGLVISPYVAMQNAFLPRRSSEAELNTEGYNKKFFELISNACRASVAFDNASHESWRGKVIMSYGHGAQEESKLRAPSGNPLRDQGRSVTK
jgi:hypothetical protein